MALIRVKTLNEFTNKQLSDWMALTANQANINKDSMIYMDAQVISNLAYLLQQDAITMVNNAFIAYATGDELSNLGLDRGYPRNEAVAATGEVTFSRGSVAEADYLIPNGTLISTQRSGDGTTINFKTTEEATLYGSVPNPVAPTLQGFDNGGAVPDGTYYYKITAVSGDGLETAASPLASIVLANGVDTNRIELSWTSVPRAVAYRVYVQYGGGGANVKLLAETPNASYTDTIGFTTESETPPTSNNTGSVEVVVPIECANTGSLGNVAANTVTKFINKPTGIEFVTNLEAISGGTDEEDDEAYRARLRDLMTNNYGKVTVHGYRQTCEAVDGVRSATVVRSDNVRSNLIYIYIVAESGNGIPNADLIQKVQDAIDADDGHAVCDDVIILPPFIYTLSLDINVYELAPGYTEAQADSELDTLFQAFFPTVAVGGYLRVVDINNVIHDSLSITDFKLVNPSSNIQLDENQMVVLGTINTTYNLS